LLLKKKTPGVVGLTILIVLIVLMGLGGSTLSGIRLPIIAPPITPGALPIRPPKVPRAIALVEPAKAEELTRVNATVIDKIIFFIINTSYIFFSFNIFLLFYIILY